MAYRVCFVCTGNICRSPMAEVVLRHGASVLGVAQSLEIDSGGTAADVGFDIDRRARQALERRGYEPDHHRARQFEISWFAERDLVIALDSGHVRYLRSRAPKPSDAERVRLLLSFPTSRRRGGAPLDIPDPYFGDDQEFESCLDLVQEGCAGLLSELEPELAR